MNSPFSKQEAEKISKAYQGLSGLLFNPENITDGIIECVAVTPFDILNKQKFILYYILLENAAQAESAQRYKGTEYDVVIVARKANDELEHTDICSWLSKYRPNDYSTIDLLTHHDQSFASQQAYV